MKKTLALCLTAWIGWTSAAAGAEPARPVAQKQGTKPATPQQIDALVRQLGDKDYYVRQRAQDELSGLGFEAFDALSAATADEDLEIASRARYLLRLMRMQWTLPGDSAAVKRCLRDYEYQDAAARERAMRALAALPHGDGVGGLVPPGAVREVAAAVPDGGLGPNASSARGPTQPRGGCRRSPSLAGLPAARGPVVAGLVAVGRRARGGNGAVDQAGRRRAKRAAAGTQRHQPRNRRRADPLSSGLVEEAGRRRAAMTAIRRLVEQEHGDPETLAQLIAWLVDQKAWRAVDELHQRFAAALRRRALPALPAGPGLCRAGTEQAGRANGRPRLKLLPGKQEEQLIQHLGTAQRLQNRGLVRLGAAGVRARDRRRRPQRRAFCLRPHRDGRNAPRPGARPRRRRRRWRRLVKLIDARKLPAASSPAATRRKSARGLLLFRLPLAGQPGGRETAGLSGQGAGGRSPGRRPADSLLSAARPSRRPTAPRSSALIKKAAAALQEQIAEDAENASALNQYAWLIGNTEGDFDEALRCSQKSLELQPDEPAYLDTLGHVYFGRGDLANAVKYQAKAVELEPHSLLIRRELQRFRKKLEETKAAETR